MVQELLMELFLLLQKELLKDTLLSITLDMLQAKHLLEILTFTMVLAIINSEPTLGKHA
jgi:hypothetical protein